MIAMKYIIFHTFRYKNIVNTAKLIRSRAQSKTKKEKKKRKELYHSFQMMMSLHKRILK